MQYIKFNFKLPTNYLLGMSGEAIRMLKERYECCIYHGDNAEADYILKELRAFRV